MAQVKPVAKIHAAAAYFMFVSRDPKQIAAAFNVKNTRTVQRWSETEEWTEVLDVCGYTGSRKFTTAPTRQESRDAGKLFDKAREAYINAIKEGVQKHKLATTVEETVGKPNLTRRTVRRWAAKYGWYDEAVAQRTTD